MVPQPGKRASQVQLKQLGRIGPSDLDPVALADCGNIEPIRRMIDVLERPVGRKQDAIGSHFQNGVDQRLRAEISGCCEIEIVLEIFTLNIKSQQVFEPLGHFLLGVLQAGGTYAMQDAPPSVLASSYTEGKLLDTIVPLRARDAPQLSARNDLSDVIPAVNYIKDASAPAVLCDENLRPCPFRAAFDWRRRWLRSRKR